MEVVMRMVSADARPMRITLMEDFICGRLSTTIDITFPTRPSSLLIGTRMLYRVRL